MDSTAQARTWCLGPSAWGRQSCRWRRSWRWAVGGKRVSKGGGGEPKLPRARKQVGWESSPGYTRGGIPEPSTPTGQLPPQSPMAPLLWQDAAVSHHWCKARGEPGKDRGLGAWAARSLPSGFLKPLQVPSSSHLYLLTTWICHLHLCARKWHEHGLCHVHAHHLCCPLPPHPHRAEENGWAGGAPTHQWDQCGGCPHEGRNEKVESHLELQGKRGMRSQGPVCWLGRPVLRPPSKGSAGGATGGTHLAGLADGEQVGTTHFAGESIPGQDTWWDVERQLSRAWPPAGHLLSLPQPCVSCTPQHFRALQHLPLLYPSLILLDHLLHPLFSTLSPSSLGGKPGTHRTSWHLHTGCQCWLRSC